MTWDSITTFLLSTVTAIGVFVLKTITGRIDKLEEKLEDTVTERQVRLILDDKLDPIKDDIEEIKEILKSIHYGRK